MKAIITGASSGIGEFYAKELAKRKCDVILVARRERQLKRVAKEITDKYRVEARYFVGDLSSITEAKELSEKLLKEFPDIVINNAGFGDFGYYDQQDVDRLTQMLKLNIVATHIWTNKFLKQMVQRNAGIIINTSSAASYLPVFPKNTVYANTKVFVKGFSNSIHHELKLRGSKVRVVSVEPGAINTDWYKVSKGNNNYKNYKKTPPDVFAMKVLKEILDKNKNDVTFGKGAKLLKYFSKVLPKKMLGNIVTNRLLKDEK